MAILRIQDLADPRLDPYRSLKASNSTRWTDRFVVEGETLVGRLLASDFAIHSLLVAQRYLAWATSLAHTADVLVVSDDWIEAIVGFNFHRGMLACAFRKPPRELTAVCRGVPGKLTLVVCPDVQDPENLGTILRISSAFGVDAVVLGDHCADPFSRRVLRVSAGASLRLPIVESPALESELIAIRDGCQVRLWATVAAPDASRFDSQPRPQRLALLMGSEGHGLAPQWLRLCDRAITIPMQPGVDSLNVAVAAGIMLYHLTR
jgi:tRNA G18 (ribose-2'-O)-methylase SpoU